MPTLMIRNARCVATFDDARRELADASVFIRDTLIEAIGPAAALPQAADEVIDARGHLVTPGLVNTHHHMYQSLTRGRSPACRTPNSSAGCAACTRSGPA